ncbi:MAG: hypothetical protein ACOYN0_13960, partial [Phycisphaerales bacterium]
SIGLLGSHELGSLRRQRFRERSAALSAIAGFMAECKLDGVPAIKALLSHDADPEALTARMRAEAGAPVPADRAAWTTAIAEVRYAVYLDRQRAEIRRHAELENRRLPEEIDYHSLANLRTEARLSLSKFRPRTFGQAARLEGITPADLTLLSVLVHRWQRSGEGRPC